MDSRERCDRATSMSFDQLFQGHNDTTDKPPSYKCRLSWRALIGRTVTLLFKNRTTVKGRLAAVEAAGLWLAEVVFSFEDSEVAGDPEEVLFYAFGTFVGHYQEGISAHSAPQEAQADG